jgi:hypothetical protein
MSLIIESEHAIALVIDTLEGRLARLSPVPAARAADVLHDESGLPIEDGTHFALTDVKKVALQPAAP